MKDPYQYERSRAKTRAGVLSDSFDRKPLDFHTEEERHQMAAEIERHRVAKLEEVREARRKMLADRETAKRADKEALIKRHEKWLAAWHIGLLIGGIVALAKMVEMQFQ
jgi:chemotaxis response regulator CheB